MTVPALDLDFVRKQFPAFETSALEGQAFFENAGGSYMCRHVINRYKRYFEERNVQPYYPSAASTWAGEEMDEARNRIAALLGVEDDELSFGPSTSQNTFVLAQAFGEILTEKDAIIVTDQDHEANTGAWRKLAEKGIEVREWKVTPDGGSLQLSDLADILDEKVKLVCFPHCSNIVAEFNPVKDIVAMIHQVNAVACVDGVSAAPHGWPNIRALGADIYLFSAYKTWGPHQGIMTIKRDLGMRLPNQGHYFNADKLYKRFTPAGPDHAAIAACTGIVDYLEALHQHHFNTGSKGTVIGEEIHQMLAEYEADLLQPLLDYAEAKNTIQLLGPNQASKRAATVSLVLQEDAQKVARELANMGIMAGHGHFYSRRLIEAMGHPSDPGVLRLSFVHYTSEAEIIHAIKALDTLL